LPTGWVSAAGFFAGFFLVFSCFFARAREDCPKSLIWRGFAAVFEFSQSSLFSG